MGENVGLRGRLAVALLALGCAVGPAEAQFMTGAYPVIIVPPPPAQSLVMPKRSTPPAPRAAQPTPDPAPPTQPACLPHGRTVVCE